MHRNRYIGQANKRKLEKVYYIEKSYFNSMKTQNVK